MQERYSEEVKSILEAAQQQAVMNYQQELSCAHILVALSSSEGFFRFLLANSANAITDKKIRTCLTKFILFNR